MNQKEYEQLMLYSDFISLEEVNKRVNHNWKSHKKFYKFKGIKTYLEDSIRGKFYLSRPDTFEDKQDCSLKCNLEKILNDVYCSLSKNYYHKIIKFVSKDILDGDRLLILQKEELLAYIKHSFFIGCFTSSTYENLYMWSKYALKEENCGLCLEYDFNEKPWLKSYISKVIYKKNYELDITNTFEKLAFNVMKRGKIFDNVNNRELQVFLKTIFKNVFVKDIAFRYENEYRLFIPEQNTFYRGDYTNRMFSINFEKVNEKGCAINLMPCLSAIYICHSFDDCFEKINGFDFIKNECDVHKIPLYGVVRDKSGKLYRQSIL